MTNSPHEKRTGLPPRQSIVTEIRGGRNVLVTLRRDETILTTEREEHMAEKGRDFSFAML